jgi:multidrug/hemolysin transport system permease protein
MILALTKRHLKLFFRDKASVFFSLLSVIIIIALYVLFLGDMISGSMASTPGFRYVMDSWIMAGVLAVTSFTTTMGAFGIMVDDRAKQLRKDFDVAPIARWQLILSYVISAFIIGVLMSIVTLVLAELYILAYGGSLLSFSSFVKLLGLILVSVAMSSAFVYFIVSFFRSQNAFSTASTLVGTLIGFLTGIYIPIGNLPDAVQWVVRVFPISHAGAAFRQVMMEDAMQVTFAGLTPEQFNLSAFKESLGVTLSLGSDPLPMSAHILIMIVTGLLFFGLTVLFASLKKKKLN